MSHYIEANCMVHGEWEMDSDFPSRCPQCEEAEAQELASARATIARLEGELEVERMCLAACAVAAWGGEVRDTLSPYDSDSLRAVVALRTRADAAEKERDFLVSEYERAVRIEPHGWAHAAAHLYNAIANAQATANVDYMVKFKDRADAAERRVEAVLSEGALVAAAKAAFAERTGADPSTATPDEIDQYIEIADATIRAALAAASGDTATTEG